MTVRELIAQLSQLDGDLEVMSIRFYDEAEHCTLLERHIWVTSDNVGYPHVVIY